MKNPLLFGRSRRNQEFAGNPDEVTRPDDTHILEGVRQFARDSAPQVRPLMQQLAQQGQQPTELFITCADSRIVPSLITASGPGDLFTVRNVGNLVPPPDAAQKGDTSVTAALDYCLHVLSIKHIVVCGHSGCGAMNALLSQGEHTNPETPLGAWLSYGNSSLDAFKSGAKMEGTRTDADALSQINVVQQLETLRSFPDVRQREDAGSLQLVGLFFDIEAAGVLLYDAKQNRFVPVDGDFDLSRFASANDKLETATKA